MTQTSNSSLTNKAMLVKLKIDMLGMNTKDNTRTRDININYLKATDSAGKYERCKLHGSSIQMLLNTVGRARKYHRTITRPWGDDKWRLLPSVRVMEYTAEIRTLKQEFYQNVKDIENRWGDIVKQQEIRLGPLFDWEDYPCIQYDSNTKWVVNPVVDLSGYYQFDHNMRTLADESHVVLDLEAEVVNEIKDQIRAENKKNLESGNRELWTRLIDPVKKMADICENDKKVFKTLVPNISETLTIIKDLNITNDQNFNTVMAEIETKLTGYTAGQIKTDPNLKRDLGIHARDLADKMSHYMNNSPQIN